MKAGDEVIVKGKVYVAGDAEYLSLLLGLRTDRVNWKAVCQYCMDACQSSRNCIATISRRTGSGPIRCVINKTYFFLKPEPQPITGESK